VLPVPLQLLYPFKPESFDSPTGRLSLVDKGEGDVVLLLHGNPSWSFLYRDLILDLCPRFRCLAPDHQGCGLSDPQRSQLRMRDHSHNLELLLENLGVESFHLVAHDWGGAIGAHLAGLMPERIKSMTFMNTAAFRIKRIAWRIRLARTPVLGRYLMERHNAFARAAVTMAVVEPMSQAVAEGFLFPYRKRDKARSTANFVADIPRSPSHPSWSTLLETEENLAKLRDKPVFLPWGMRDFCFDAPFLEQWKEHFPHALVQPYEDAGHYVLEDAGPDLRDRISRFISENS